MKKFLCLFLVFMMIVPCAYCEKTMEDSFIEAMFGDKSISEYTDTELQLMIYFLQFAEQYVQTEIDSRAQARQQTKAEPTQTPVPQKLATPGELKINGTTKEVNVEGFGVTMKYAYTESKNEKDYLIVVFSVKNKQDESASFGFTMHIDAFQDGVELDTGYLYGVDTNAATKFRPGAVIEGKAIFVLKNLSSQVELELNKLWNFSNDKPTLFTIDLK